MSFVVVKGTGIAKSNPEGRDDLNSGRKRAQSWSLGKRRGVAISTKRTEKDQRGGRRSGNKRHEIHQRK